ncbi:leucine-rich repeat protein soc-2 homolog [Aplysia californica]|uniref:Leucine-rich repeat protein soc-2 homolog n=1 Tax=Aplysia californica TaxID=6500 RepID=A0ABM0JRK7_APLCA|nr:leucine-rich repeat protein soc-2 homolog [Aplysia californica]
MGNPDDAGLTVVLPSCGPNCVETLRHHLDFSFRREHGNGNNGLREHNVCLCLQSQDIKLFCSIDFSKVGAQLTCLNLNYNRLCSLPSGLSVQLPNLCSFLADGNDLSTLPEDFGDLTHLQELCLCENNLTVLPETLCRLKDLKILKVRANSLRQLYSEIGQNTFLEVISVDENRLKRFPATIGLLKKLRILEANDNKIETLPSTVHFLESLRTLDLSRNRIDRLPDTFGELRNLRRIDFSNNKLTHLCGTCKSASVLEYIFLDSNQIAVVPEWFCDLESVKEITLKGNELFGCAFKEQFGSKSTHLESLDLRGNYLDKLPSNFTKMTSLKVLLMGTPLEALERNPNFLNGNWLTSLPEHFADLESLTTLRLEENQLSFLPEDFGRLSHLEELLLGNNFLYELPASFPQLESLTKCQLTKNRLEKLPSDFGALTTLQELHLDSNRLRDLPESMSRLTNLEILDLSENKLRRVPSEIISSLHKLKGLTMLSNKFEVPDSDIPQIVKRAHYEERNPEYKGNWRGRNNRPEATQEALAQELNNSGRNSPYFGQSDSGDEDGDAQHTAQDSSDEEEDWDKEIEQSISSSTSTENYMMPHKDEEEEDWEKDLPTPLLPLNSSKIEPGQFDLDDELRDQNRLLQSSPLSFDFYGNPSKPIDQIIESHKHLPYLLHASRVNRRLYVPPQEEEGQFDSDDDGQEHDTPHSVHSADVCTESYDNSELGAKVTSNNLLDPPSLDSNHSVCNSAIHEVIPGQFDDDNS